MFHQVRNLMDLMETISKFKGPDEEVAVHAITVEDAFNFANMLQQHRQCKEFNVTYVRMSPGDASRCAEQV
jgi:hypothetical protein